MVYYRLDGTFEIEVKSSDKLKISFLGLGDQIITVGNQQNVIVRLEQKVNELADVVVVGYGRQKKESVVGAISTVDVSALKVPGASLSTSLQDNWPVSFPCLVQENLGKIVRQSFIFVAFLLSKEHLPHWS